MLADFKEQCNMVRSELEQAYKSKLNAKMDKFKSDFTAHREHDIKKAYEQKLD